ncbi:hypothetical protein ACIA5C_20870 [Actinoplanes sp. NPDC051343]|uniref:hypothetical protein n=1 Tax=Actinoplanes sp. NPDC051343 TaxID=3363906 RepID=UPI00378D3FFB
MMWYGAGAGAAAVVVVSLLSGAVPYASLDIHDPGVVVRIGAPLIRLVVDAAATVCIGALVFAAC